MPRGCTSGENQREHEQHRYASSGMLASLTQPTTAAGLAGYGRCSRVDRWSQVVSGEVGRDERIHRVAWPILGKIGSPDLRSRTGVRGGVDRRQLGTNRRIGYGGITCELGVCLDHGGIASRLGRSAVAALT